MLQFLLVKKYLFLIFVLLLTSVFYVKADHMSCTQISNEKNQFFSFDQLNNIKKKEPSFYPNPVRDFIKLTNQDNVTRIRVMSLTGKTLVDLKTTTERIDLSHLSKGMYLINFDLKNGKRVARKLVKK